ncbi:MAG: hypothetical protein K2Y23_07830 [Cyanobacteria bacterium]|nr:hypothetical protein [Cyanobacteriota bacterium]
MVLAAAPAYAQSNDVTGPKTLNVPIVTCTDLPIAGKPIPRLTIAGPHSTDGSRTALTNGLVVIHRTPGDGLAVGQQYVAQRARSHQTGYSRPGDGYGSLRVTGWLTIYAIDEFNALASIDRACDSVEAGDFLEPWVDIALPSSASPPVYPDFADRANVIFGANNRTLFGDGDVFSIDRGSLHGVTPGQRFAVYRDYRLGTTPPLVYMGDVVAMTVSERTTKVVVVRAVDGIMPGDVVVPRRPASQQDH